MNVYIVLGFQDINQNGNLEKDIYGAFGSEELANECIGYLKEELEFIDHFEIEVVQLNEFGYK